MEARVACEAAAEILATLDVGTYDAFALHGTRVGADLAMSWAAVSILAGEASVTTALISETTLGLVGTDVTVLLGESRAVAAETDRRGGTCLITTELFGTELLGAGDLVGIGLRGLAAGTRDGAAFSEASHGLQQAAFGGSALRLALMAGADVGNPGTALHREVVTSVSFATNGIIGRARRGTAWDATGDLRMRRITHQRGTHRLTALQLALRWGPA